MSSIAFKIDQMLSREGVDLIRSGFSNSSTTVAKMMETSFQHFIEPMIRESEIPEVKFMKLMREWKEDTIFCSSITQMSMHPSYQMIIGMGHPVVELILNEMKKEPDHWFWALKAITSKDPVPHDHRGNIEVMTEDWLDWGRRNGYIE